MRRQTISRSLVTQIAGSFPVIFTIKDIRFKMIGRISGGLSIQVSVGIDSPRKSWLSLEMLHLNQKTGLCAGFKPEIIIKEEVFFKVQKKIQMHWTVIATENQNPMALVPPSRRWSVLSPGHRVHGRGEWLLSNLGRFWAYKFHKI